MKIGILADIHGNSRALREVARQARAERVEQLLVLGDMIGYYYDASDVLKELHAWPVTAIRGNHERLLAEATKDERVVEIYRERYGNALAVALKTLTTAQISWLVSLPDYATVSIDGLNIELCHGSPRDKDEYVYPDASADLINACSLPGRDFILMGHTHYPMVVVRDRTCLLNPGSVGQARDVGGFASWCLFETNTCAVRFFRTGYNVQDLMREAQSIDPHIPMLASVLARNNPFINQS